MSTPLRFTSADLELLPDVDGVRYEIIDGELTVSKSADWRHQNVCSNLNIEIGNWNRETRLGRVLQAAGLIFAPDDDVIPDLIWISRARLERGIDDAGHIRLAPELVVEVLSAGVVNERRDRELKLKLYSRQGVTEYWIVDWRARMVQVFRRGEVALALVCTLHDGDTLTSPVLPGFSCPVSRLWDSI
ncbi:MAG: Uma2 family endonuclease [Chloroflexota bacterium]